LKGHPSRRLFGLVLRRILTGIHMSFSWFTSNSPDAQPSPSKEPEGPSEAKGSFSSLAFLRNSVVHNDHSDMTQDSQTVPSSESTKPETEPASTAEKTAPVVAFASGTISISIASHAVAPADTALRRRRKEARGCPGACLSTASKRRPSQGSAYL